ncbi:MAG: ABC transporter ATP-binding protein [Streptosporangiaceae bacterium]
MIELANVSKRFGATTAVRDVSFSAEPGRVTAFLGPNGAGKTTTLRLILGLDRPTAGTVRIGGRRYADRRAPAHDVGAVLDETAAHPRRRARDHLLWIAAANGIGAHRVNEVLSRVGLADVARRRVGTFSLGMKQRLGVAAALLGEPSVLMFDEPLNGLDPAGIRWARALMKDLAGQGRTVLVSSHLMSEMAQVADHALVIARGRIIADCPLADLSRPGESLEDAFLRLTEHDTDFAAPASGRHEPAGPEQSSGRHAAGERTAR